MCKMNTRKRKLENHKNPSIISREGKGYPTVQSNVSQTESTATGRYKELPHHEQEQKQSEEQQGSWQKSASKEEK